MEKNRISADNNFGLIRLTAAFLVFAGHMFVLMGMNAPALLLQPVHRLGVIIFFICGGFLISKSWERDKNYLHYMIKRIFRIIPAMAVYCLFAACIIGPLVTVLPLSDYFRHPLFKGYFKNIVLYITYFLPGVFEANPYPNAVNGSIWSLPVEFMMYFFVPILLRGGVFLKRKFIIVITCLFCAFSLVWQLHFADVRIVFYAMDLGQVVSIVPYYLLGVMVAKLDIDKKYFNVTTASVLLIICSAVSINSILINNVLSYLLVPYFVFSIAFGEKGKLSDWIDKFEISYGIFLYGFMIQQLLIFILYSRGLYISFGKMLILCWVITVILSMLSSKYIERPMIRLSKKIIVMLSK